MSRTKTETPKSASIPAEPTGISGQGSETLAAPGWVLRTVESVASTNDAVADWPVWTALRAVRQTGGRGRHQRKWVSNEGGLWISAVVPMGAPERGWAAMPLVAGLAVCEMLLALGVRPLRLRWPNDVMSGDRKLAGLLVDCFRPGRAVVGLGLNLRNHPDQEDVSLAGAVVRLADLIDAVPDATELAVRWLGSLRDVVEVMAANGFASLADRMNRWWETGQEVEIEIDSHRWTGFFEGVDNEGRLKVRASDGVQRTLAGHQVTRLREFHGGMSL